MNVKNRILEIGIIIIIKQMWKLEFWKLSLEIGILKNYLKKQSFKN